MSHLPLVGPELPDEVDPERRLLDLAGAPLTDAELNGEVDWLQAAPLLRLIARITRRIALEEESRSSIPPR